MPTVKLTYFKPSSGKYYSEGQYDTTKTLFHEIVQEVLNNLRDGIRPGLTDCPRYFHNYHTLITIEDPELCVPHLIPAPRAQDLD